jgi:hypothetical protein
MTFIHIICESTAWHPSSMFQRNTWVKGLSSKSLFSTTASDGGFASSSIGVDLTIGEWVNKKVREAMKKSFGEEYYNADTMITPATKANFGDFQCNAAFSIAKPLNHSTRDVATKLAACLEVEEVFETPTIAGTGYASCVQ